MVGLLLLVVTRVEGRVFLIYSRENRRVFVHQGGDATVVRSFLLLSVQSSRTSEERSLVETRCARLIILRRDF